MGLEKTNVIKSVIILLVLILAAGGIYIWQKSRVPDNAGPEAKTTIQNRAQEAVETMKNKDFVKLSTLVHPEKGVRFSPYAYVDLKSNLVFTREKIEKAATDQTKYVWDRYDAVDNDIEFTFVEYFKKFVYSQDFASAPEVSFNQPIGGGNTTNNVKEAYPEGIFVEYHFSEIDPAFNGMDWESLRLVFEELNGNWYLVGTVHDQWTI